MSPDSHAPHSAEEESYFVSMTDLMVGMLFVFIILLMTFALNMKDQQKRMTKQQITMEQKQAVLERTTKKLTDANDTRRLILESIRESMKRQGVEVIIDPENGVLRLPEQLLFTRGDFHLRDSGKDALRTLASVLVQTLHCYATAHEWGNPRNCPDTHGDELEAAFIEGHTDDVPITARMATGISNNWELSTARAIETYRELVGNQPGLGLFDNSHGQRLLGASGYAEHRPVRNDPTEEARAMNRRIDLRFLMAAPSESEVLRVRKSIEKRGVEP